MTKIEEISNGIVRKSIKMKSIFALAFLAVGISGTFIPERRLPIGFSDERIITNQIEKAIEDAAQAIKDAGLDPFHIKKETSSYALPVPVLFNYEAFLEDLLSTGLSNIKTHRVNYSVITSRLTLDIELPLIHFSTGAAKASGVVFSNDLEVSASGKIDIVSIRVEVVVRVSIGVISGISIRSIDVNFRLGDINSDVNLTVRGRDYSDVVNDFVGNFVPDTIKAHNKEINELLEIVLKDVIEANLP
ncbi:hypothetical protein PYW07_014306 [Mythimna separata]|uniref:Uncharacterized protein n=1 Tax=Mythimna separata TaxID=271217 RepID=A0AAD7YZI8_MYTSE|nr:hypothetical protein PYW07_014306 [Mythimna separata]